MQEAYKDKLSYCQALNLLKDHGLTSSEDLAMLLGCTIRTVDRKLDFTDVSEFKASELIKIARHLSRIGQNQVARLMLDPKYKISLNQDAKSNGIIDDEITEISMLAGHIVDAFRAGDKSAGYKAITALETQISNAKAEFDRL